MFIFYYHRNLYYEQKNASCIMWMVVIVMQQILDTIWLNMFISYVLADLALLIKLYRHDLDCFINLFIVILMTAWFIPRNIYKCCNKLNLYVATSNISRSLMVCTYTYKRCRNPPLCVATLQRLLVHVINT